MTYEPTGLIIYVLCGVVTAVITARYISDEVRLFEIIVWVPISIVVWPVLFTFLVVFWLIDNCNNNKFNPVIWRKKGRKP